MAINQTYILLHLAHKSLVFLGRATFIGTDFMIAKIRFKHTQNNLIEVRRLLLLTRLLELEFGGS